MSGLKWASLVAQLVKNHLQSRRPRFDSWVGKICWRRDRLPTPVFWPREFHGLYSPWGRQESDMTEQQQNTILNAQLNNMVSTPTILSFKDKVK